MTEPEEMDDEELWLANSTTDLQAALDELEADLPPGVVEAWLKSFQEASESDPELINDDHISTDR